MKHDVDEWTHGKSHVARYRPQHDVELLHVVVPVVLVNLPRLLFVSDFGDAQNTGVNTAALLILCALTYTTELLSREETEALGVKWFGNATAVSSLDSLLVPNGDYSSEFNWCDTNGFNSCKRLMST